MNEDITFDFEGAFTYVIRDIPHRRFGHLSDIEVIDADGDVAKFDQWEADNKTYIQIFFDHQDELAKYTIRYLVHEGIGYFGDYDEWYWNVDPLERSVPIAELSARVHMPPNVNLKKSDIKYTFYSDADKAYSNFLDGTFIFAANGLGPKQHMTIVAGFPKDIVDFVLSTKYVIYLVLLALVILGPIIFFFVCLRIWRKHGRNKRMKGVIVPQYEPFEGITPAESEGLLKEGLTKNGVSAAIVSAAEKGYIRIREVEQSGLIKNYDEYILEKVKSFETLPEFEKKLLKQLFKRKNSVNLSDKKHDLASSFYGYQTTVGKALVNYGFFDKRPSAVRLEWGAKFTIAAMLYLIGGIILMVVTQDPIAVLFWVSGIIMIIMAAVFAYAMPATTPRGSMAYEHTLGFKEYLHTAERFRLKDVPPSRFSELLPYAVAFGVAKEWAERFKDIVKAAPSWYVSSGDFSTKSFTNSLSSFNNTVSNVYTSAGGSASSSSGFSGGSIGGGGGGGGISAG